MNHMPFFSICIPVYKNVTYLGRLLDSLAEQTFEDYEVVISDDSPDERIAVWLNERDHDRRIKYYRNAVSLGTPENWNEAIRRAGGQWIKIMHDDDWFATPSALQFFYDSVKSAPFCKFHFSAFQNVYEKSSKRQVVKMSFVDRAFLKFTTLHLFRKVYVGNPSCTLISSDVRLYYDNHFKFVVDFEYYIRVIGLVKRWTYIDRVLINVGFNDEQVTVYTKYNPAVQIPENNLLLRQMGFAILKNVFVYDYYWRMYRNVGVRSLGDAMRYDPQIPAPLRSLIQLQSRIPISILKFGVLSKILMLYSYLVSYSGLHNSKS